MKVVIFGCQQIAVNFIEFLNNRKDIDLPLVITYELPLDKTYGYESVLERGLAIGLNVLNPKTITEPILKKIKEINPDIIFSLYYRKIFPPELLRIPKLGCINIHPGMLPRYRGPVPTAWAIRNGEKKFGITIHYMDKGIDTGDILIQKEYHIKNDETGFELYTRGMNLGAKLLIENFNNIINQKIKPRKQKGIGSYYGKMNGRFVINWHSEVENVRNSIRVHAKPYNPSESILFNRYVLINKAKIIRNSKYVLQGTGTIMDIIDDDKLVVSCADGCLLLEDYEIVPKLRKKEKHIYLKVGNELG